MAVAVAMALVAGEWWVVLPSAVVGGWWLHIDGWMVGGGWAAGGALVDDSGPQRYVVAMVRRLFIFTVPASPGPARSKIQNKLPPKASPK